MDNLSLEDVASCFNSWRVERKTIREPVPKELRAMAASLYPSHKRSLICRRLRLSGSQLSLYIGNDEPAASDGFVTAKSQIPQSSIAPKSLSNLISMTLNGKERSLHFSVSPCLLPEVLKHIKGLL